MIVPGAPCLVHHPTAAWVPGVVEHFDGKVGSVKVNFPKAETLTKLKEDDIFPCDEKAQTEDVDDLLGLTVLHDGTLLNCLRARFFKDIVYTNIGAIAVAVNPFNFKIPWYMDDKMREYLAEGDTIQKNLPHSWAIAHNTYYEMRNDGTNQCVLVSGESGAGKTEASKIVMKYLSCVAALRGTDEERLSGQQVGVRMIQSNPILEAFGNAKTVRNDNSSRFGKLMKIKFSAKGLLTGADITKYLLEKSRIITASQDERVYHAFYLLLQGSDREKFHLDDVNTYKTVTSGRCVTIPDVDDGTDYRLCNEAMGICGVSEFERESIWTTLAAILSLQQLDFVERDADSCVVADSSLPLLDKVGKYWEIDPKALQRELLTTTLEIQKQKVVKTLTKLKAYDARDALCKATYDNVFAWLVTTINRNVDATDCHTWIALLDIFGFEDFKVNSFEQLCINLANETLQCHYNNFIFVRDMEECRQEGIDTTDIVFPDNKPCIDMISAKGGILAVLDEECMLGKATDLTFLDKISDRCSKNPFFEKPRLAKVPSFRIHHYAGSVTYEVDSFLEKNRDTLKDAFKIIMRFSDNPFVAALLPEPADGMRFTVGGYFKSQLKDMMELINSTSPHWIRCIKPHPAKKPRMFDGIQTLSQLRSSGVLGTVQIRKAGYPIRMKLADFVKRYKVIARGIDGVDLNNLAQVTAAVFKAAGFGNSLAQLGKTRAFMKSEAYQQLEIIKKNKLQVFATTAVVGAQVAHARLRTACFMRHEYICRIQAALAARQSQKLFRKKDYDTRKDSIIAQVKLMLKVQMEEEAKRKELERLAIDMTEGIRAASAEAWALLEARWWDEKPARDLVELERVAEAEVAARRAFVLQFFDGVGALWKIGEDEMLDAVARQEEREEEERLAELQHQRDEEERLRQEERVQKEKDRIAAAQRLDEQRQVAIYYWNLAKHEAHAASRQKKLEEVHKKKWISEASAQSAVWLQLKGEERQMLSRERRGFPDQRFSLSTRTEERSSVAAVSAASAAAATAAVLGGVAGGGSRASSVAGLGGMMQPGGASMAMTFGGGVGLSPSGAIASRGTPRRGHADPHSSGSVGRSVRGANVSGDGASVPRGIGGLSPLCVNPAVEKARLDTHRLEPDATDSLQMVQRLRRLRTLRDATVLCTPVLKEDDPRNPANPSSPDWHPPNPDVVILPDGTELKMAECALPTDEAQRGKRRRRHMPM